MFPSENGLSAIFHGCLARSETELNQGVAMRTSAALFAFCAMSLFGYVNAATVYRCTDAKDMVQSQLTPCAPGEKQEIIGGDGKTDSQRLEAARASVNPFDWRPKIGMTTEQVRTRLAEAKSAESSGTSKFQPDIDGWFMYRDLQINRSTSAHGVSEQWVFLGYGRLPSKYLYFDDGILTSIQD
jgi:hypothetical protein